jgi:WD40 repeat protein
MIQMRTVPQGTIAILISFKDYHKEVLRTWARTMKNVLFFLLLVFLFGCNATTPKRTATTSAFVSSQALIPTGTAQPTYTAIGRTITQEPVPDRSLNTVSPAITSSPKPVISTPFSYASLEVISLTNIQQIRRIASFLPETKQPDPYPPQVTLSPDSQLLAYYDPSSHKVKVWDWKSQREIQNMDIKTGFGPYPEYLSVEFNSSGDKIAVIRNGPEVWDTSSGQLLLKSEVPIKDHTIIDEGERYLQNFTDFLFSSDGSKIFTGSWDAGASFTIWDMSTGKIALDHPAYNGGIQQLVLSPDNRFIVTSDRGGHISFYDPMNGNEEKYPIESICRDANDCQQTLGDVCYYGVDSISVTNNGKILAVSCSTNDYLSVPECDTDRDPGIYCGSITFYDTETWKKIGNLNSFRHKSGGITYNKDGGILAFGIDQSGNRVEFWGTVTRQEVHHIDGFPTGLRQVKFSHDGRILLIQTIDGDVQLWGVR